MIDKYVFSPLIYFGLLPETQLFLHRSITHTVWSLFALSFIAWLMLGKEYFKLTFVVGLFAHLISDMFAGSVQLLKPLSYYSFSFPQFPLMIDAICFFAALVLLWKEITLELTRSTRTK